MFNKGDPLNSAHHNRAHSLMVKRVVDIDESVGSIPTGPTSAAATFKMQTAKCKIIYEDESIVVYDKPAGINADDIPKRAHRLDKDTSGVLLVAKNDEIREFLQKQFQEGKVEKKYLALVVGSLKNESGIIESYLGRSKKDPRKQKVYSLHEPHGAVRLRYAITEYSVLRKLKDYTLCDVRPRTGRKHQIRAQFAHLGHPIAGDKLYGFKNQPSPEGLKRQFLHASSLIITLPTGEKKTFSSPLPKDLELVLSKLEDYADKN